MKKTLKVIGLMSGTSADGVDTSLVEIGLIKKTVKLLKFKKSPYPKELTRSIIDISIPGHGTSELVNHLNFSLGERFANAAIKIVKDAGLKLSSIDLIGTHGQTISHIPREIKGRNGKDERFGFRTPSTLQIGEAAVIAKKTGIHTVSDFRTRDIAEGGEGAPLTPYAHYHLFSNKRRSVSVHNLGGISNLTYLKKGGSLEDIIAFDTGPGNMLIDGIMFLLTEGKKNYDINGSMARKGKPDELFIRRMMQNPYLRKPPPKSTGREDFGLEYSRTILNQARMKYIAPADLIASVTYFTARTIGLAYRKFVLDKDHDVNEAIFCGGGINNKTLMNMIKDVLSPIPVKTTDDYKIPGESLESIAFALLAHAAVTGIPANIPAATGAREGVVLGKITPGSPGAKFHLY